MAVVVMRMMVLPMISLLTVLSKLVARRNMEAPALSKTELP